MKLNKLVLAAAASVLMTVFMSVAAFASAARPATIQECHPPSGVSNYDYGCYGAVEWSGSMEGSTTNYFTNQIAQGGNGTGDFVFEGTWVIDKTTSDCTSLVTGYCYIKAGVVKIGSNAEKTYIEWFMPGDSAPHVGTSKNLVTADFGQNTVDTISKNASPSHQWTVTVKPHSQTAETETAGSTTNDFAPAIIHTGLQISGNDGTTPWSVTNNQASINKYQSIVTHVFNPQANDGVIASGQGPAVGEQTQADWATKPSNSTTGGVLSTCTTDFTC